MRHKEKNTRLELARGLKPIISSKLLQSSNGIKEIFKLFGKCEESIRKTIDVSITEDDC